MLTPGAQQVHYRSPIGAQVIDVGSFVNRLSANSSQPVLNQPADKQIQGLLIVHALGRGKTKPCLRPEDVALAQVKDTQFHLGNL